MKCPKCGVEYDVLVIYGTDIEVAIKNGKIERVCVRLESMEPKGVECHNCLQHAFDLDHPAVKVAQESDWPDWESG